MRPPESNYPVIDQNGDRSILIRVGSVISEDLIERVIGVGLAIEAQNTRGIVDVVPAYTSLMIHYDPEIISARDVEDRVRKELKVDVIVAREKLPVLEIPVCYDAAVGPDIDAVSAHCEMGIDEIIARHVDSEYRVFMLGFIPGFVYLGGMDESLTCPRLETPRKRVAGGSIGIAGSQTGIYSLESPGGWQIIGRTPLSLFDSALENPFLARHLQEVRFRAISLSEFEGWNG